LQGFYTNEEVPQYWAQDLEYREQLAESLHRACNTMYEQNTFIYHLEGNLANIQSLYARSEHRVMTLESEVKSIKKAHRETHEKLVRAEADKDKAWQTVEKFADLFVESCFTKRSTKLEGSVVPQDYFARLIIENKKKDIELAQLKDTVAQLKNFRAVEAAQ